MSNDSYDSNWGNNPSGSVPPFMAPWLQFMRLWTQSMTAFMPGGSNLPNDWLNAFMPGLSARPPLSIRVASPNPATVTVQFAPMAEYRPTLKTESLTHQKAPDLPKIKPANIQTRNGRVHISLNIPATQPAGRYRGYILDSNGDRCGRLTVEVQTPAAAE